VGVLMSLRSESGTFLLETAYVPICIVFGMVSSEKVTLRGFKVIQCGTN